jgi:hypothetical protein
MGKRGRPGRRDEAVNHVIHDSVKVLNVLEYQKR